MKFTIIQTQKQKIKEKQKTYTREEKSYFLFTVASLYNRMGRSSHDLSRPPKVDSANGRESTAS